VDRTVPGGEDCGTRDTHHDRYEDSMARPHDASLDPTLTAAAPLAGGRMRPLVAAFLVVVLAISAQIAVMLPGTPVPVTLQDLAVLVVGVLLGGVGGALTVATYVLIGALGAPIYSNGHAGVGWLFGPTGGYLLAFPVSALLIGLATEARRSAWLVLPGLLAAWAAMFLGGVAQLMVLTGRDLGSTLGLGVLPFLPGVAFKSVLLLAFAWAFRRWRGAGSTAEG
jgi:biotin transport system substrate-specific component